MSFDMTEKFYEQYPYGKAALKKMGNVPENFRLYSAGLQGRYPDFHGMEVSGAEFREAKTGKNKGKLYIMIANTRRTVYVSNAEIAAEDDTKAAKQGEKA